MIRSNAKSLPTLGHGPLGRRAALLLGIGGTILARLGCGFGLAEAQEATPRPDGSGLPPGVGRVRLLAGAMVEDMPRGAVDVRVSRLTVDPGALLPIRGVPYPTLKHVEAGEASCPGGPARIVYDATGNVINQTLGLGDQLVAAGATQYVPANASDGTGNQGPIRVSILFIEFVPVEPPSTPA